jgi:hypothetical protein
MRHRTGFISGSLSSGRQGTAILTEAKGGEILSVLGPLNRFELPGGDAILSWSGWNWCCAATSSGTAPEKENLVHDGVCF